ncbi:RNA-guided endonuclease TnpB family protein [Chloracidobacterium aggregatum]|uniref:Transposase n=1 Tax=Chloracidobacterium sp. N TaxID=2821540 RepID=A0ABX8B4L0_9BACT|nr:RNA-guided endonuclease TnpB family protein [Chloracidobacterium aggregatum]QUV85895.1 transposase [Chloracidobacterium sp. 2]QUV89682.1 transposase [Chloracidobacterium sp. S]QUV92325.1 transposase [Chloracidobacterium sp. A]QUV95600.1 transposase [Chloracidobacterium sp. N]QUV98823.1 transposase [Chloracidobacterium sp. E]
MRVMEAKLLNGTAEQYQALDEAIRTAQFVRNKCVRYWMDNKSVNKAVLYAHCKDLAKEFDFARKLNSAARQASAERAWASISRFHTNCRNKAVKKGYPKFRKHCRSVEYKVSGWKLSGDGMSITFTDGFNAGAFALYCNGEARHHILNSKINRVRVIRRADGYYAQFCLDVERKEQGAYTGNVIGIDLGVKAFHTDQNGNPVEYPKFLRRSERRLKQHQRRLSRKFKKRAKSQSKNYHKQRKRLGKVHLKVQRQRKDWAIKQARCVVASHDVVAYEDLQVKNLVKNHHLAKSIHDAGWSQFTAWLDYYGKVWDKAVVSVPPQYTTQDCSNCGHRVVKTLSTRTHSCPKCGFESDRDQNAALNILKKGLSILGMEWQNSTFGQKGTASKEGTLGERCTAALEGQPDEVSALAEPRTRIPCL